ncbi:MAG: xanthine dehydrogenase family protein subunit M [Anaerolineae bacterium]|nr:xanthine dehydrogenase family protein subunit M [Anaerolineae bacterium]
MLYKKYYVAQNIEDAVQILAGSKDSARLIAGGTDLLLQLNAQPGLVSTLVDISSVGALREISQQDGKIHIGAAATYAQIRQSELLARKAFLLVEASRQIGANQIQNMGTIGGNVANASPAGDMLPCLYALDAWVNLHGAEGSRSLPISDFIKGYRQIDRKPDEIIVSFSFNALESESGSAFVKFGARKAQAISIVNAAAVLTVQQGKVKVARLALGSVAPTVVRSRSAEALLQNQQPSAELFQQAGERARGDIQPIDDIRASAAFRRHIAGVITSRALSKALERI